MERSLVVSRLKVFSTALLDSLYPIQCLGCEKEGSFLCASCLDRIPERDFQECPLCRAPYTQSGAVCKKCRKKTALDGLLVAAPYKNRLIERAIHTYKYRFIEALSVPLGKIVERALAHNALPLPDAIVPVPLHTRRLRFRGFNQAELLAEALAQDLAPQLGIPILETLLFRTRFTRPQMETKSKTERENNLSGAFAVSENEMPSIQGKYLWLIDDVATTGTTLEECAKALKLAGAKTVWGIVIAR